MLNYKLHSCCQDSNELHSQLSEWGTRFLSHRKCWGLERHQTHGSSGRRTSWTAALPRELGKQWKRDIVPLTEEAVIMPEVSQVRTGHPCITHTVLHSFLWKESATLTQTQNKNWIPYQKSSMYVEIYITALWQQALKYQKAHTFYSADGLQKHFTSYMKC